MNRLKVGDKVKILPRKEGQEAQWPEYTERMLPCAGIFDEVSGVANRGRVLLNTVGWTWHEDWLEKVADAAAEPACPFEVGKEYRDMTGGSYTFVAYIPYANANHRTAFIDEYGDLCSRYVNGKTYPNEATICAADILPEPPKPKFEPKVGTWETRDGETMFVTHFEPGSEYPICGVDKDGGVGIWDAVGWNGLPETQLVKYLGPLPEEMTTWQK